MSRSNTSEKEPLVAAPAYADVTAECAENAELKMKLLKEFFRVKLPAKTEKVKPGIYHYRREAGGNVTRFHLRVEEDGSGMLLANASVAARLSETGVLIAKLRLEGVAYPVISRTMKESFYGANEQQIESDVRKISQMIGELANLEDNYPVFNLDDPAIVHPRNLMAPFHAQMRVADPEKNNSLMHKLWNSGIMHVTFSADAGDPAEFARRNVERAEDLGMISGVRGMASWFLQPELFKSLALAGIDYVLVPAISSNPEKQDAFLGEGHTAGLNECLQLCKKWEVTAVLEIPIFRGNVNELDLLVNDFTAKGGNNVLYYAISNEHQPEGLSGIEIIQAASILIETTHRSRVRYVWLPAVSAAGDLRALVQRGPGSAGDVSIRVEPDGSVYPPRGPMVPAGNLQTESLKEIWDRDVFKRYRERVESPTHCDICPELEVCGAACPADPAGWAREETV